mmetsp:Transcript_8974/g.21635  ORF Transcript_8974/g.21635 Transcript_8974/m.21635 type:complete len:260 (-) Transcript_8974:46-825(-)
MCGSCASSGTLAPSALSAGGSLAGSACAAKRHGSSTKRACSAGPRIVKVCPPYVAACAPEPSTIRLIRRSKASPGAASSRVTGQKPMSASCSRATAMPASAGSATGSSAGSACRRTKATGRARKAHSSASPAQTKSLPLNSAANASPPSARPAPPRRSLRARAHETGQRSRKRPRLSSSCAGERPTSATDAARPVLRASSRRIRESMCARARRSAASSARHLEPDKSSGASWPHTSSTYSTAPAASRAAASSAGAASVR